MKTIALALAVALGACRAAATPPAAANQSVMPGIFWMGEQTWDAPLGEEKYERTYQTIADTLAWWGAPADLFAADWTLVVATSVTCTSQHMPTGCYALIGKKMAVSKVASSIADPVRCVELTDLADIVSHVVLGGDDEHTDPRWPAFRTWVLARAPADCW
jgi:hypothetical protein